MKLKTIKIENFRAFGDETIQLNKYSCFVGPNGAGKSTVLAALNVFFQERSASSTDTSKLSAEDFFSKQTGTPVRITVTFNELAAAATKDLAAYVRQEELVVSAEAIFDAQTSIATVRHYGQRLGIPAFREFFDAEKAKAKAPELQVVYDKLRQQFTDLPSARSKDDKLDALRSFEEDHADLCALLQSEDDFYGVQGAGKLARFVQWVYVPAVKDAGEEGQEAKNTALGRLIARAVRARTSFEADIEALKTEALTKYKQLLERNQVALADIAESLQQRLEEWAHPDVRLGIEWLSDPLKSVVVQQPVAGIKTGDGDFVGSLSRMGHGLQRSYLLALLQELASSEAPGAPTLILGCEEPELYQHPPQARHLADVFEDLANGNNQVLVTTHCPLFVSGEGFENVRMVRRPRRGGGAEVSSIRFADLCRTLREVLGEDPERQTAGLIAKIHQALQPGIAEMFFARVPVLVEGLEDVSYITTELFLSGRWAEFRRLGCHLIPVNGKDKLIQPLAIAKGLGVPAFVLFDSDGDEKRHDRVIQHERDNKAIIGLLGSTAPVFPPGNVIAKDHVIWPTNMGTVVKADFGAAIAPLLDNARTRYANEGSLEKNELFIADWLSAAKDKGLASTSLTQLCSAILDFARDR